MGYRCIVIENRAYISSQKNQLIINTDRERKVPIEDISAIVISNNSSTITTAALSRLGAGGCAVFFCDEKHLPCSIAMPFHQHSRQLSVMQRQINMTEPMKKRIWQQIVTGKIENQAECLKLSGIDGAEGIRSISGRVRSGDTENSEATAAQRYFPLLFGDDFRRSDPECGYNPALNYGYAILRGAIARSVAAYGLIPAIGVHHKNALDQFCLADDLIEPFRPVVDLLAKELDLTDALTPEAKRSLVNVLNLDVCVNGEKRAVSNAIELTVQSFVSVISGEKEKLKLPELVKLKQHSYE